MLTIDLTNRCNMMCDPCFMDANQVGYVHELTLPEVKQLLDDAVSVKPRRQMTVQFSGGEPTISPIFLDAVRYAREVGYFSVQAATNGIRFAQDPEFAMQARDAGMRIAYLQFDGVTEAANSHRKVGNLFDVKLRADRTPACGGHRRLPRRDDRQHRQQRSGRTRSSSSRCRTATRSASCRSSRCRSPDATRTSRDEERHARRYTLSHLAHDMQAQTGVTEPLRDWFPLSASSAMSSVTDLMKGPGADWGSLSCGCHPDCGVGMGFMVSKKTKEWAPLSAFVERRAGAAGRARRLPTAARGRTLTAMQTAAQPAAQLLAACRRRADSG